MKKIGLVSLIIICSIQAFSQSFYNYRRGRDIIASLGTGTTTYFGDLKDNGDYFDPKFNLNLGLQYFFNKRVSGRVELQWFSLEGADEDSEENGKINRNLSFKSNNYELNAVGMIQAFPNGTRYYQRKDFNFYAFAGIGLIYFNPKAEYQGKKYALQPIQTEGVKYSRIAIVIPYGGGIRYKIDPFWNVGIEVGFRQTFTDYIDDVSTTYIDNTTFSDPIHATLADRRPEIGLSRQEAGSKRGNPDRNDNYLILNLKVEFYLPAEFMSTAKFRSKRRGRRAKGR
ncbi:DUF6089 family protein [Fulvivirga lutimaris]|uniref:DUF6089 family protein n=1 Tax=Fulvivirga lutimaris TaxID=1819566 RepID=UPI0012BCA9CC|nr:DUF6089 family protein [Fulvivirga lutimaris]MTI38366.1 hypothetical protein [Fulvivirga lutimaris]